MVETKSQIVKNKSEAYGYNYASLADIVNQGFTLPKMEMRYLEGQLFMGWVDDKGEWHQGAPVILPNEKPSLKKGAKMVWSDEPTETQLGTIFSWIRWHMTTAKAAEAVAWLKKTATRRDVSVEMTRLKELRDRRALNADTCFVSDIWEGFEHD